jgi:hypothetical protein
MVRKKKRRRPEDFAQQMETMANDPHIQKENREIQAKFSFADMDGLENELEMWQKLSLSSWDKFPYLENPSNSPEDKQ